MASTTTRSRLRAAESLTPSRGSRDAERPKYAEAAQPIRERRTRLSLVSNSIEDSLGSVALVEHRLADLGAARASLPLPARLRRRACSSRDGSAASSSAAERIASGKFDEPIVDTSPTSSASSRAPSSACASASPGLEHARREFIANASHELRTPLFSLGGYLELLVEEDLDERPRGASSSDACASRSTGLTKLAGELLDLSRLDAGASRVDRDPVDLAAGHRALARGVRLASPRGRDTTSRGRRRRQRHGSRRPAADPPGRPRARRERAAPHAGRHARARERERNGDRVALSVEDDGPGISETAAVQVFERFYRGDTGGRASGSGLGLAIARELAVAMQGEIELSSSPVGPCSRSRFRPHRSTSSPAIE